MDLLTFLRLFVRLSRLLFLVGVAMLFALGAGIAHYLGIDVNWNIYLLGQGWVTLLQLSTQYLNEFFNAPADKENSKRTFLTGGSGAIGEDKLPRRTALFAGLASLTFLTWLTVLLLRSRLSPEAYLIMAVAFLGAIFYSTPPIKLEGSGYGELTTSVMVAFLVPAFSFILQADEFHRFVSMSGFPLTALHMAMLLAFELPDYANDMKFEKRTLMIRLGWQGGMMLHNLLILSAFLLLILATSFGYPWFATWPSLLSLPVGLFQIWQMRRISQGARPNWNALTMGALALFALMAYMMTMAFWIN